MSETPSHKRAKAKAAGRQGKTEVPLKGGGRLDAATGKRATEVERSGNLGSLKVVARRLKASDKSQKVLQVPQPRHAQGRQSNEFSRCQGHRQKHERPPSAARSDRTMERWIRRRG